MHYASLDPVTLLVRTYLKKNCGEAAKDLYVIFEYSFIYETKIAKKLNAQQQENEYMLYATQEIK